MTKTKSDQLPLDRQKELVAINKVLATLVVVLAFSTGYFITEREMLNKPTTEEPTSIVQKTFPVPDFNGIMVSAPQSSPLVNLLKQARYAREFDAKAPVSKEGLSALVWAAQGQITDWGERTVPSYRSQFPLEVLVLARRVEGVAPGWYQFEAKGQQLVPVDSPAMTVQNESAPAVMIVKRTNQTNTTDTLIWEEAGGVAQNILLMAADLHLAAAFTPAKPDESPLLWQMAIGRPINK